MEDVTAMDGDEVRALWRERGNNYKDVYPTRNGIDMYTLSDGEHPLYFHTKAQAKAWVKEYVTDPETAEMLMSALANYRNYNGHIRSLNDAPNPI